MSDFLNHLPTTSIGVWVLESTTGYPILLVMHSIGLALLVGIFTLINLRILGFASLVPLRTLRPLLSLGWVGFSLAAISGGLLFTSDAPKYFFSPIFRVKLISLLLGAAISIVISRAMMEKSANGTSSIATRTRVFATCSMLCWLGAIAAGRLMAYLK